jgi:hypothetical protein
MRKKIGKRIGPVPIALVAVFALAAFISAGFWLVPNSAHAQSARASATSLEDVELDVGESLTIAADVVSKAFEFTIPLNGSVVYSIASDQDDEDDDTDGIETTSGTATDDITITEATGEIGISAQVADQTRADLADNTATITVTATVRDSSANTVASAEVEFDVTIAQNPIEQNGAMVMNPPSWVDGGCEVATDNAQTPALTSRPYDDDNNAQTPNVPFTLTALTNLVSAGDCLSSDDEIEVSFTNSGETTATELVYVTGGDDFIGIDPQVAADGLDEHILQIPVKVLNNDGEQTITVSRSMANDSGVVYLIGYAANATEGQLDDDSTTFKADADFVVKAVFLNPPVEKNDDGDVVSKITFDDDNLANNDRDVMLTLAINDANGHPVSGFVNLTVAGSDDVVFEDSILKTHRVKLSSAGMAETEISGLPKSGPFKIEVTATIGELTLKKNIVRMGAADMVAAAAYVCNPDVAEETEADHDNDPETDDTREVADSRICIEEVKALKTSRTSDDPDEVAALGPEGFFFISAKATDTAGNTVESGNTLSWAVTKGPDNESDAKKAIDGADRGKTDTPIMIASGSDAVAGNYSITVTSKDGKASTMVEITVSDAASMIMVSCVPEMIPTDSGLTDCTVTVTDANGNIPSNLHAGGDKDTVRVAVRSAEVTLIGTDGNDVELDNEGMAMFSILLREDAPEGSRITVNVSSTIGSASLQTSTSVVYGDPPSEPGMPMNVMAEATSHDMITVTWDAADADGGSDITGYMVQSAYMMADDMMSDWMDVDPAHMGMDMMYMDMGLMAETTYYYRVAAMNAEGMGEYSDGMAMAMTMADTDTSLQAIPNSSISVTNNANSAITVSWMGGDNADSFIVVAAELGSDPFTYERANVAGDAAKMTTITGLNSGSSYIIIVIALQGTSFEYGVLPSVTAN